MFSTANSANCIWIRRETDPPDRGRKNTARTSVWKGDVQQMNNYSNALVDKSVRLIDNGTQTILSANMYNLILGCVVMYGLIVNVLMCHYLAPVIMGINPITLFLGYLVLVIAGVIITYKSDRPIISFLGYNLVVVPLGAVLTVALQGYESSVVFKAFFMTAVITAVMMVAATLFPGFFAGLGKMLFIGLIGILLAQLLSMFLNIGMTPVAWAAAILFSLYIGYDWVKAQMYVKTLDNAIDSALDIYLDIVNLFLNLLRIISNNND